ncbi:hypothetical protein IM40_01000 [Candidatus Paracaedimonas acanthamoebae]|nr:hypothetical protein IM40_01000 [Candidatus Paracaedimonas acanthamoebae]
MKALFKKFIFFCFLGNAQHVAASVHTFVSQDVRERLVCNTNSLYFAIDIPNFTIYSDQNSSVKTVHIHLHLNRVTFPVFYDRPIRKIFQTTIEEILAYLYCSNKRDLTLTLMVPLENKSLPLAFRVRKSAYHADLRKIEFIAELVASPALEFLQQTSLPFKGGSSSLLIDG